MSLPPKFLPFTSPQVAAAVRAICARAEGGDSWDRLRLARIYRAGDIVEKDFAEAERLLMKVQKWDRDVAQPELFLLREARYREIIWAASTPQIIVWQNLPFKTMSVFWTGGRKVTFPLAQIEGLAAKGFITKIEEAAEMEADGRLYWPAWGESSVERWRSAKKAGTVRLVSGGIQAMPLSAAVKLLIGSGFVSPDIESKPEQFIESAIDEAASHVRSLSLVRYGEMLLKGEGVEHSVEGAAWFFAAAANCGITAFADLRLAEFHLSQKKRAGVEEAANQLFGILDLWNYKSGDWSEYTNQAAALLFKGAEDGHAPIQRELGRAYLEKWIPLDEEAEERMTRQRNEAGNPGFWERTFPWPDEWQKAGMKWLRCAAEQGDEEAAGLLRNALEFGGVKSTPLPEIPEPDDFRIAHARKLKEKRENFRLTDGKIYAIFDAVANCPIYVGQTRGNLESRIARYNTEIAEEKGESRPIVRKMRELGENGYYFRVLERGISNQGDLDLAEEFWIAELGTYNKGYNMTVSGQYSDRRRR